MRAIVPNTVTEQEATDRQALAPPQLLTSLSVRSFPGRAVQVGWEAEEANAGARCGRGHDLNRAE